MSEPDDNPSDLRAKVYEDREFPDDWCVEKMDADGGNEVAIFGGPNARERALRYAEREYGEFDEIEPGPYPSVGGPFGMSNSGAITLGEIASGCDAPTRDAPVDLDSATKARERYDAMLPSALAAPKRSRLKSITDLFVLMGLWLIAAVHR